MWNVWTEIILCYKIFIIIKYINIRLLNLTGKHYNLKYLDINFKLLKLI